VCKSIGVLVNQEEQAGTSNSVAAAGALVTSYASAVAVWCGQIHDCQTIVVKFSALYPIFQKYFVFWQL